MKEYHHCSVKLRRSPRQCWHQGVLIVNGRHYCRTHVPKAATEMDEPMRTVVTAMAEHIVRLAAGSKGKASILVADTSDLLWKEVKRVMKPKT